MQEVTEAGALNMGGVGNNAFYSFKCQYLKTVGDTSRVSSNISD